MATKKSLRRLRIKRGIRKKLSGSTKIPRLSVFRSNEHIYAQVIDDNASNTVASASTMADKMTSGTKIDKSKEVGKKLAEKALKAGVSNVVFDRNGFLYHGRVKALAEAAREAGLKF